MIVVVCPGQGSQTPGFLEPWVADPAHRALLEQYGDAAGIDLVALTQQLADLRDAARWSSTLPAPYCTMRRKSSKA